MEILRESHAESAKEVDELVASEAASAQRACPRKQGMTMLVEGSSHGVEPTERCVATILSLLNTKPMASPDQALRIIRCAQDQLTGSVPIGIGITCGTHVAVLFDTGMWIGEIYRYGPQTSGRVTVRDWQHPIDLYNLPDGAEAIRLQLFWLYPIEKAVTSSKPRWFQIGPTEHSPGTTYMVLSSRLQVFRLLLNSFEFLTMRLLPLSLLILVAAVELAAVVRVSI